LIEIQTFKKTIKRGDLMKREKSGDTKRD